MTVCKVVDACRSTREIPLASVSLPCCPIPAAAAAAAAVGDGGHHTTLARPDPPKAMVWRPRPTTERTASPAVRSDQLDGRDQRTAWDMIQHGCCTVLAVSGLSVPWDCCGAVVTREKRLTFNG